MAEQLSIWNKVIVWSYERYSDIGASTIGQLKKAKIIPSKEYWAYEKRKPDALLVDRRNKNKPNIIAVCEYKSLDKFKTEEQRLEAIQQCNDLVQELDADMGIITDNQTKWIWINWKQSNQENEYNDKTTGKIRSYSIITDEQKQELSYQFTIDQQKDEINNEKIEFVTRETIDFVERVKNDIWEWNSGLKATKEVDPTSLAKSVRQDIFVATWQEPEKCLYNVVELFVFKFLSDLKILKSPYDFESVLEMTKNNEIDGLDFYAKNVRDKIRELFPASSDDNTTIINGTIFVNEKGESVKQNSGLFLKSLKKYQDFGELTNVKKDFKTKLYETFLKRDSGVKWLWQYFTPRKVIKAIVEMSQVEKLQSWAKVCDPFCGTWGFVLEALSNPKIKKTFEPNTQGKVIPNISFRWYDKWSDEKDSERTIILAKANMMIYLSDIIRKYPNLTQQFSIIFNNTFKLKKDSILWTLNTLPQTEEDKYDLILTNPPYVTTGSSILKEEIKNDANLTKFYAINGMWVEGLSVERIIRNLKPWGKAFVIIPDWILHRVNDKKLRQFILDECFLNWIISLPINTFFTTNKKTYILILTKKHNNQEKQELPVFTYLVSDIGETLDVYRFDTGKSDLEEAKGKYLMFQGAEEIFKKTNIDPRCKVQDISVFEEMVSQNRIVDRRRTEEEKVVLGIAEEKEMLSIEEFLERIIEIKWEMEQIEKDLKILL